MTPCGDNASACAASGHVSQSSPKREDMSPPAGTPLLADYYARPNEAGSEEKDSFAPESILRRNFGRIMQAYKLQQARDSEHNTNRSSSHRTAEQCSTAQVTTSSATPRMSTFSLPAFKEVGNQPLDLSTSKRPHSNEASVSKPLNYSMPSATSMQNISIESRMNNSAHAAVLPIYSQVQPILPVFSGEKFQRLYALAYMQNKQRLVQQLQEYDSQKWITALREQQLASAMHEATKTPRKRTISVSF